MSSYRIGLVVSLLFATISAHCGAASLSKPYLSLYTYDGRAPLNAQIADSGSDSNSRRFALEYSGKDGKRVSAIFVLPADAGAGHRAPCLLLLNGLGGTKEMMLPLAGMAAQAGYASCIIDIAGQGAQQGDSNPDPVAQMIGNTTQTVVNLRRAIDYLQTRPDINSSRIGLVGISLGAMMGTVLAGVDNRVAALALISGGGDMGGILESEAAAGVSIGGQYAPLIQAAGKQMVEQQLACIDPLNFVGDIAPRPLLMEEGRTDTIIAPQFAKELFAAAGDPKQIDWYDAGHVPSLLLTYSAISRFFEKYLPVSSRP